jgi:hypothetical protein
LALKQDKIAMMEGMSTMLEEQTAAPGEPTAAAAVSAMCAEYAAIREEMRVAAEHQRAMIQLGITIFAAVLTLVGIGAQAKGNTRSSIGEVLLLVPLAYVVLALTTADAGRRIIMMANYLHHDLGKRVETELEHRNIWRWENHVKSYHERMPKLRCWTMVVVDKARWLIFALPSTVALIASWIILMHLNALRISIIILDVLLLLGTITLLIIIDRTSGIEQQVPSLQERMSSDGTGT